jgi:hypothetical protein
VPTAAQILATLTDLAQSWWPLAVAWHVYVALIAASLLLGSRPTVFVGALMLSMPLASVVAMAWLSGNSFTGLVLGSVLAGTLAISWRLRPMPVTLEIGPVRIAGVAMVLFGLVYPGFLEPAAPIVYLYAAPLGIVPCPTLSAIVGFSLVFGSLNSRSWSLLVGSSSLFYGVFGALHLGVALDWVLVAGSLLLLVTGWTRTRVFNKAAV